MNNSIVDRLKHWGNIAVLLSIILELIFFFSLPNIAGCAMTFICWSIFKRLGLNNSIIKEHPFAWLVFASMSLYRILPIIATLLEWKPIAYKFELPYETFFYETLLYIISALAFYFATREKRGNGVVQKTLKRVGFYEKPAERVLWMMGFVGVFAKLVMLATGQGEEGVVTKLMTGFVFLQTAPILLFFPSLYKGSKVLIEKNRFVTIYIVSLLLLSFATNSRQALLVPIGTFVILFFIALVSLNVDYRRYVNFKFAITFTIISIIALPLLSDISAAMILTRGIRGDVSRTELFEETWKLFRDKETLRQMEDIAKQATSKVVENYQDGWTEEYVDNFALNRYCNIRITDITLYHANKVGFQNEAMQNEFVDRQLKLFPTPILSLFGIHVDKSELYSRGDILFGLSGGVLYKGLRVTSHVADGLVTFGYLYFIIQFLLFYLQFIVLDWFVYRRNNMTTYSLLGLVTIFAFLAMFRNANGCSGEVAFLVRGFIQMVFIYTLTYNILKRIKF